MTQEVSILQRIDWVKFGFQNKSISEIFEIIRNGDYALSDDSIGDYSLRDITNAIRSKTDESIQNEWKHRYLPVVTFNGLWMNGVGVHQYSNYTALDFDYIASAEERENVKARLMATPCAVAVFRTLKPNRLKAIILHDNADPSKHKDLYEQLMKKFGLKLVDDSCKDLNRRNYLVWDESIWVNPAPIAYHYTPTLVLPTQKQTAVTRSGKQKSPQSIISIMSKNWGEKRKDWSFWHEGIRNKTVFQCACMLCEFGVPQDMAEDLFIDWAEDGFDDEEIVKHVEGAYNCKKNEFGSRIFI